MQQISQKNPSTTDRTESDPTSHLPVESKLDQFDFLSNFYPDHHPHHLLGGIMDTLQYGILIVALDYRLLYANSKAHELCQDLCNPHEKPPILSQLITELCGLTSEKSQANEEETPFSGTASLVMECLGEGQQTIRVRIHPLHQYASNNSNDNGETLILILLENCDEKFQTELSIECKKYALTEREAEVWGLLKQGYTYQEVASHLHLSVNTIKTHVKHINSKRQNYHKNKQTVWFSH